jgi:hypothetical protein
LIGKTYRRSVTKSRENLDPVRTPGLAKRPDTLVLSRGCFAEHCGGSGLHALNK